MKIKTGTDIIEIERVKASIEDTDRKFCERVYTEKEIEYCESKKMQKYQHYAARFAAKEAVFKAISKTLNGKYDITWKDIEVLNFHKTAYLTIIPVFLSLNSATSIRKITPRISC